MVGGQYNGTGLLIPYAHLKLLGHQSRRKWSPDHEQVEVLPAERKFPGAPDRLGRRRTLIVGAVLMVLAGVAFVSTGNLILLIWLVAKKVEHLALTRS